MKITAADRELLAECTKSEIETLRGFISDHEAKIVNAQKTINAKVRWLDELEK